MAYEVILVLLFFGGLIGWSLFAYSLASAYCSRRREITMIKHISEELKKVRKELKELK